MNGLQLCWDFKLWIIFAQVLWMYLFNFKPVIATVHEFYAVAGNRISMPCNITAPSSDDVVTLVLWYKGDMKVPIYTLDARKGPIEKSKHFPSSKLGRRVHFDLHVKNPGLAIDPVKGEDAGTYRCRVEYKRYRTLSYQYELKVIVPPREVNIMDDRGQRIEETIGPVDEGSNVTLICEAEGGSPSPSVTWWRDSVLLDDTYHITTQGYVRNDVILIRLKRSDLSAIFTCQAANNNLTVPTSYSVTLDLNLRPLDVRIITLQPHLSAGKKVTLECESTGSRPRAVMTWWKGSQKIQTGNEVISDNGNLTLSTLSFVPTAEDHGKKFTCTAENPSLPNSLIEDTRTITVHYIPELRLALGASIQHTAIKEGSDVYFDCNIRANPWVHDVSWRFEDNLLFSNLTGGIIVSNQSLVLQRVKKEHRGRYQCVATNSEGEGRSEEVPLDVQFVPVCKNPAVQIFGVAKQETLNITCELDGDPKEIEFHWALNNTVESMEVKKFISDGLTSTVYYTPRNMLGYGALLCWGINNIGRQRDPCVYRVVPVAQEDDLVLSPIIGILIGIVSAFAILFIVIAVIIKRRTREKRKDSEDSKQEKCEIPIQNYKEESIDSTIESPDVIPADSQVYTPDAKSIHLECTRRMNEEMYKLLKQKQDNYDSLIPMNDQSRSEVVEDISYTDIGVRAYHKRSVPLHMEPPTEYADVYRHGVRTQVLPLPECIRGDRIVATTPL
ncbi:cell surface glycoprotein MUC18 isoform X6 [Parasteatoda tepidariorum]|uniref:cell surface glycoprotein MUC18 isoform X6 n=1 Tax=Parasteatoda tepidariorum TaxID=114398 RepID=UPI0039BC80CC